MTIFTLNTCRLDTLYFNKRFQAYRVNSWEKAETKICSYESLVDFNVHHIHEDNEREQYVPVKYDLPPLTLIAYQD